MKVGVILPLFSGDPAKVVDAAREAESLGYDGVFAFDHFFPPGAPPDRPSLEVFSTLGAVAAATDEIAIGTLVARASLRPVGLLAKSAAWLDAASGGRFVLGLGTGDATDRAEHIAYGIPMLGTEERRAHLGETVRALKALFCGDPSTAGELVPRIEGPLAPPPAQTDGPPVWLAGHAEEILHMAGRLADGWNGWGLDVEEFRAKAAVLARASEEADRVAVPTWAGIVLVGRDEDETTELLERRQARGMDDAAWVGTTEELAAFFRGMRGAGAAWVILVAAGPRDRRRVIAREVLAAI